MAGNIVLLPIALNGVTTFDVHTGSRGCAKLARVGEEHWLAACSAQEVPVSGISALLLAGVAGSCVAQDSS